MRISRAEGCFSLGTGHECKPSTESCHENLQSIQWRTHGGLSHSACFAALVGCVALGWSARAARAGQLVQDTNFTAAIFRFIEQSEYDIRWIDSQAVYKAANRAQNLRFTLFADGFAVEPRDYGEWTVESNQAGALLGYSVAGGLVEGEDWFSDLIIGVPYYDTTSLNLTDNGEAWFYRGVQDDVPTLDARVWGTGSYDHNGWGVAYSPHVQYRSRGIIVGAPDAGGAGTTAAYYWRQ